MRILVAEDDALARRVITNALADRGHEIVPAEDGAQAWEALQGYDAPELAVLDWVMPRITGVEICRRARREQPDRPLYLVLVTANKATEDIVQGLEAGADDYLTKPFDVAELRARIGVGIRLLDLQKGLHRRVQELEQTLARVELLHSLLPICAACGRPRTDEEYQRQLRVYLTARSQRKRGGTCPRCRGRKAAS
jgi:sigma-B regulation protein RsbU (phosphoserine phosphatase)